MRCATRSSEAVRYMWDCGFVGPHRCTMTMTRCNVVHSHASYLMYLHLCIQCPESRSFGGRDDSLRSRVLPLRVDGAASAAVPRLAVYER